MLQLIYISSAVGKPDSAAILATSQRNNRRDGVTGLLFCDGMRFLQVLEGPESDVEAAFERIRHDPRHKASVVLSRRTIGEREFGEWAMAERDAGESGEAFVDRVDALLAGADANLKATFAGLARLRRAA